MSNDNILPERVCAPWKVNSLTVAELRERTSSWIRGGVIGYDGVECYLEPKISTWLCHCHHKSHSPFLDIPASYRSVVCGRQEYLWSSHGKLGRREFDYGLPAQIKVIASPLNHNNSNPPMFEAVWHHNDRVHREDGPADYTFIGSKIIKESFYIDGKAMLKEKFVQRYEFLFLKPYKYEHDPTKFLAHTKSILGDDLNLIQKCVDF